MAMPLGDELAVGIRSDEEYFPKGVPSGVDTDSASEYSPKG